MNARAAATLDCRVRASRAVLLFNRGVHGAGLAVVLILSLCRPWLLLLTPLVVASWYHAAGTIRLRRRDSIRRLRWTQDGDWWWQLDDGRERHGRLLDATVLGHYAVILRLRAQGRRVGSTPVLLAADSLAPDMHRRLRVRLTLWHDAERDADFSATLLATAQERLSRLWAALQRRR